MWSFLVSVLIFAALVLGLAFWQRLNRRATKQERAEVNQQIHDVAEIAQRRYQQRFGRPSTDLKQSFTNGKP